MIWPEKVLAAVRGIPQWPLVEAQITPAIEKLLDALKRDHSVDGWGEWHSFDASCDTCQLLAKWGRP